MRSLDELYIGSCTALIASDAYVPYRTSARVVPVYTSEHVTRTLEQDLLTHGALLVMRMDRASCHRAPVVLDLLRSHRVLLLHGPARYPQYYGQHERQNREHRAWLGAVNCTDQSQLQEALLKMVAALNGVWRRPGLGWQTSTQIWSARRPLAVDRLALHEDVLERTAMLREKLRERSDAEELAGRLAIEQALGDRGLMSRMTGGWC